MDDYDEDDFGVRQIQELEEGDRLLYIALPPAAEFVRASTTFSAQLAEAARKQSTLQKGVPHWLKDFEQDVFSKESFDILPDRKIWDHAIELIPGSTPSNCKVYPLAPNEQKELDDFLKEHLSTGRIRPSKSPMASPVFFVKKKERGKA